MSSLARRSDPDPKPTVVGTRLKALLAQRGWSIRTLAARSGISPSQISLVLRGHISYPRISTLQRLCSALGVSESALITPDQSTSRHQADLQARQGVTTVPVVRLVADGRHVETGHTCAVALSHLQGHERLLVAVVNGGGMAPHVMVGDRILFDPDRSGSNEQMVLLLHGAATLAAWRVEREGRISYWLADGSRLDPEQTTEAGVILYIMRSPPAYRTPA
jgi:transcriptional regulator with XRE-family HTH domain